MEGVNLFQMFPRTSCQLSATNKATGPKIISAMSSPSVYRVSSCLSTSKPNDIYDICKQIYASSLDTLIEIFEVLVLTVH